MKPVRLIIFLKAPVKGRVKTRLAQILGDEATLSLYRAFVRDILNKTRSLGDIVLYFTPENEEDALCELTGRTTPRESQQGAGLGEKMARAFENEFNQGAQKVLLMGTDVPDVPGEFIKTGADALDRYPAVIAPSTDGGYFLIGFTSRGYSSEVFNNIPWSTPAVLEKTLEKMRQNRIQCHMLPFWADVDTGKDFSELTERLRSGQTRAPHTWAWIKAYETGSFHHHSGTE